MAASRERLDAWLAATEWVAGDVSVSSDAMRSSATEPDPDEPVRYGPFIGLVIRDDDPPPQIPVDWIP